MNHKGVAVIGLAGQSAFLSCPHFPQPGETVSCSELFYELGGKGYNQAIACARMQIPTAFIGAVGKDMWADACEQALLCEGIDPYLIPKNQPTTFAMISRVPGGENTVQVYPGAARAMSAQDLQRPEVISRLENASWLVVQNELSEDLLYASCCLAKSMGLKILLNPAPAGHISNSVLSLCDLITPNYGEACAMAQLNGTQAPSWEQLAAAFREKGFPNAVITLGSQGCVIVSEEITEKLPAFKIAEVTDTTGAGDTFTGTLAAMLSRQLPLKTAAQIACIAAGNSVTKAGAVAAIPTLQQIHSSIHHLLGDFE